MSSSTRRAQQFYSDHGSIPRVGDPVLGLEFKDGQPVSLDPVISEYGELMAGLCHLALLDVNRELRARDAKFAVMRHTRLGQYEPLDEHEVGTFELSTIVKLQQDMYGDLIEQSGFTDHLPGAVDRVCELLETIAAQSPQPRWQRRLWGGSEMSNEAWVKDRVAGAASAGVQSTVDLMTSMKAHLDEGSHRLPFGQQMNVIAASSGLAMQNSRIPTAVEGEVLEPSLQVGPDRSVRRDVAVHPGNLVLNDSATAFRYRLPIEDLPAFRVVESFGVVTGRRRRGTVGTALKKDRLGLHGGKCPAGIRISDEVDPFIQAMWNSQFSIMKTKWTFDLVQQYEQAQYKQARTPSRSTESIGL